MSLNETIVEEAALGWLGELGYVIGHGPNLAPGEPAAERESFGNVVLVGRLRDAIQRLNLKIPEEAREDALRKVLRVATPSLIGTNRLFHAMLRDGVEVEYRRKGGDGIAGDRVQLVDYSAPDANDWLAVNQFTVIEGLSACGHAKAGQINRRPDVAVFINGLPLVVVELKNAAEEDATTFDAFKDLQVYKEQIPSLFHYNAVVIASDSTDARIGTISSDWERMMPWRTVDGDALAPAAMPQLEILLRGVFDKRRFLDLLRYFIVFEEDRRRRDHQEVAGCHQFHAVNTALAKRFAPRAWNIPGRKMATSEPRRRVLPATNASALSGTRRVRASRLPWSSTPGGSCWNRRWKTQRSWFSPTATISTTSFTAPSSAAMNSCAKNRSRRTAATI